MLAMTSVIVDYTF